MKTLTLLFTLILFASSALAQGASVIIYELDAILTNHCASDPGDCIADGQVIEIRQDINNNGPTDNDPLAIAGSNAGEWNFNTFVFNGEALLGQCGQFFSELAWTSVGALPLNNRFWLRVQASNAIWRSNVFVPLAGPQDLDPTWRPCEQFYPCIPVNLTGDMTSPGSVCISFCPDSLTARWRIHCVPNSDPPYVHVNSGCSDCDNPNCTPTNVSITGINPLSGWVWEVLIQAAGEGCACFTLDTCARHCAGSPDLQINFRADGDNVPLSACATLCAGAITFVRVCSPSGAPLNPLGTPIVSIIPGCDPINSNCDGTCPPITFLLTDFSYDAGCFMASLSTEDIAGCVCVTLEGFEDVECHATEYPELVFGADGPSAACVDVCTGSETTIIITGPNGSPLDPFPIPILAVNSGCESGMHSSCARSYCSPGLAILGNTVYDELSGYFNVQLFGIDSGCVCISLDSNIPVEFGEFSAVPGDNKVRLVWNTRSETDVDYFELSRNSSAIAQIEAHNNTSGAEYSYTDNNVVNGTTYTYSITTVNLDGSREQHDQTVKATPLHNLSIASDFALYQNYPNPFNAETTIEFSLSEQTEISLNLYDISGRFVKSLASGMQSSGRHPLKVNFRDLPSGIYFYTLSSASNIQTQKLLLLN